MGILDKFLYFFKLDKEKYLDEQYQEECSSNIEPSKSTIEESNREYIVEESVQTIEVTKPTTRNKSINEEYAIELLLSGHLKGNHYKGVNGDFCTYYEYSCHVTNPGILDKYLYDNGYYRKPTVEESFTFFTIPRLKEMLKQYNLKVSGNKPDLIKRLVENAPEDFIKDVHSKCDMYFLSEKGMKHYQENIDLELFHKNNYYITIEEYAKYRYKDGKIRDFYEICHSVLKNRLTTLEKKKDCMYVSTLYNFSDVCSHLNKYEDSLYALLLQLYYEINALTDLSGAFDDYMIECFGIDKYCNDIRNSYIFHIDKLTHISRLYDYFSYSMVCEIYDKNEIPYLLISKQQFYNMINDIHNNAYFDSAPYYDIIINNYIKIANKLAPQKNIFRTLFSKFFNKETEIPDELPEEENDDDSDIENWIE